MAKDFLPTPPDSHPSHVGLPQGHPPLDSFLGVPLMCEGCAVGMVAVGNRPGGYGADQLEALEALAPAMLKAIDHQRAEASLRELTETLEEKVNERTKLAESRAKQLQYLAVELAEAEERERRRIADILHDDLQQLLASAKLGLQAINPSPEQAPIMDRVNNILKDSINKARGLSHELSPSLLQHSDFVDALQWLKHRMQEHLGLDVEVRSDRAVSMPEPLKTFLFRALQELLFNIVKHAQTKKAEIVLSSNNY